MRTVHEKKQFGAGILVDGVLRVPVLAADPGAPDDGEVWLNETDGALRAQAGGVTIDLNTGLDAAAVIAAVAAGLVEGNNIDVTYDAGADTITIAVEALTSADIGDFIAAVRSAISITDTATLDLSYAAGALSGAVLDSPLLGGETKAAIRARSSHTGTQTAATISDFAAAVAALSLDADTLEGMTAAQLQAAITAAIVNSAPGTLDTLNELAAALGDDPNFATTMTNALNARSRFFAATTAGGAVTEVITHNLGTRDVLVQWYTNSGTYGDDDDFRLERTSANTVTLLTEDGTNIPAGLRVVITTAA